MHSDFLVRVLTAPPTRNADGQFWGCGMATRPSFYSGRGATTTDLSSRKLECIYQEIDRNVGPKAAMAFARMVRDIPVLSATAFLLSLEQLVEAGWHWEEAMVVKTNGTYAEDFGSALGTVACVLSGDNRRDETVVIRHDFLRRHDLQEPRIGTSGVLGPVLAAVDVVVVDAFALAALSGNQQSELPTQLVPASELPAAFAIPTTWHRIARARATRVGRRVRVTCMGESVLLKPSQRVRILVDGGTPR